MDYPYQYIQYKGYQLSYRKFGNGSKALLAFHGFNRSGDDWAAFEKHIGDVFTIYAFNIFIHTGGQVDQSIEEPYIGKTELSELISHFMRENKISRVSLIGYSLGGKMVLCLIESMPGHIDDAYILAPDGFKLNLWNRIASKSFVGRFLFNNAFKNPKYILKASSLLLKGNLIHKKLHLFLQTHLNDKEQRQSVINIWTLFKDLIPDRKRVRKHILRYKINFHMFFGKYDVIIPAKTGEAFGSQFNKPIFHLLDCGHNMSGMVYEICSVIRQSL